MPLPPLKSRSGTHGSEKRSPLKTLRNMLIIIVILAAIIIGLFLLYLWLSKPKVATLGGASTVTQTTVNEPKMHKPPDNVPIGSSIQAVSSPIAPGGNGSLTLRTTESAMCSIKIVKLDKQMREMDKVSDSGLSHKKADDFGMVTWTWTMSKSAVTGPWQADITCWRGDKSTRSLGEIMVK